MLRKFSTARSVIRATEAQTRAPAKSQAEAQAEAQVQPRSARSTPVEFDVSLLKQIGGGVAPNNSW